jgi:hypothetical protein
LSGGIAYLLGTNFIVEGEIGGFGSDWNNVDQTGDSRSNTNLSFSLRPSLTLTYVVW